MLLKISITNKFQFRMIPNFKDFFFRKRGEIHYIGGAEVLPAPLDAEREADAIGRLGTEEDTVAKSLLVEHNLRLVVYIAKNLIILELVWKT